MKGIVKRITDKTIEYILSLPNGSDLAIYQAAKNVRPDETNDADEEFEVILAAFDAETEQLYNQVIQNVAME